MVAIYPDTERIGEEEQSNKKIVITEAVTLVTFAVVQV